MSSTTAFVDILKVAQSFGFVVLNNVSWQALEVIMMHLELKPVGRVLDKLSGLPIALPVYLGSDVSAVRKNTEKMAALNELKIMHASQEIINSLKQNQKNSVNRITGFVKYSEITEPIKF